MLVDHGNITQIIDDLKRPREDEELTVIEKLETEVKDFKIMFNYGWPYQDVMYGPNGEVSGIPINLAKILLVVLEFCAEHNIDLVDALADLRS